MELPKRKNNRLTEYDYSQPNAYFITICTKNRRNIFWESVGASIARPKSIPLSENGKIAEEAILNISRYYPMISVDNYVVMPNHIHLLLQINTDACGRAMLAPTISVVVQQMKGYITKELVDPFGKNYSMTMSFVENRIIWKFGIISKAILLNGKKIAFI